MNDSGRWDLPEWTAPVAELPGEVKPATFVGTPAEDEGAYWWRTAFAILLGANLGMVVVVLMVAWVLLWP